MLYTKAQKAGFFLLASTAMMAPQKLGMLYASGGALGLGASFTLCALAKIDNEGVAMLLGTMVGCAAFFPFAIGVAAANEYITGAIAGITLIAASLPPLTYYNTVIQNRHIQDAQRAR